jgi:4-amino-4-deoxychorismate lyase
MTVEGEARLFAGTRRVPAIAPGDRALAYGDGLFETLRVHAGTLPWWPLHWARLARGGARLGIDLPEPAQVQAEAAGLFADGGDGVLKLLVARGGVARGYAPAPGAEPRWMLARHPLPPADSQRGIRARWCDIRLAVQPVLAGIKHCNRLEQVLARAECVAAGTDEGLLCDSDGDVVSATSANLFVLRDGTWLTPPVDRCGVAGTCRAQLLGPLQAREARLDRAAVENADAVVLCNAVRGILPLASLGARTWEPHHAVAGARRALARLHPGFAPGPDDHDPEAW